MYLHCGHSPHRYRGLYTSRGLCSPSCLFFSPLECMPMAEILSGCSLLKQELAYAAIQLPMLTPIMKTREASTSGTFPL